MNTAERGRDAHHRLDKLIYILGVYKNGHGGDAGELVVEDGLAFHDGHGGDGPYISQTKDPCPVRADGDAASDHGQLARQRWFFGDGLAGPRHAWGVHGAHVLHRPDGVGRFDHELPTLVLEERPVARPQDFHSLQFTQHAGDPLRLITVLDFQRDLPHGSLAADVYRRHVPDQTVPFRYRAGDPGQLPRAVRYLDAVRVVERQNKPPDVPAVRSRLCALPRTPRPDSIGGHARRPRPGNVAA